MTPREYGQSCSLACALDRIGERWTLLIVRELSLGPLRFSALARSVGGAPTDILTKRLRDLEQHGIVERRELDSPASTTVYELTELGRGLERPMVELGRWGMELQKLEDVVGLAPSSLPGAVRVILRPPADFAMTLGLRSDGQSYELRIADGWIEASRGTPARADVSLAGTPIDVIAALVAGEAAEATVDVEGDRELLDELRSMIVIPEQLREEALAAVSGGLLATARTA
ncbi:MAG TPA: helix-turn-helix domain-containing protein [Solirubrobacterales bacterium]|jgi:DNA-binding HxlR family transcriptional regulator|nr:helix-turn-helix domain-containing protein [Solirubrobacterales bacterium]